MDTILKDFLTDNNVRNNEITELGSQGIIGFSTFIFSANTPADLETNLITPIKNATNGSIGAMARLRAAHAIAKNQNPSLCPSPSGGLPGIFSGGLGSKLIVSDEFSQQQRDAYKNKCNHDIFEKVDPANNLLPLLLKEEQMKKYSVTTYNKIKTRREEREKEFKMMSHKATKLEIIGKNLHIADPETEEEKSFSFYAVWDKLHILASAWDVTMFYLIQKLQQYARDFPTRKVLIITAEAKVRDLWIRKKIAGA